MSDETDFVEVEHTADWAIQARGATLPDLFVNAAIGMYSLMVDRAVVPLSIERVIEVSGVDTEALLVNWLNELVYHTEMDGEAFGEFHVESFEPTHLQARVRGGRGVELKKQVKAVTFHDLSIKAVNPGYEVTIVFDV